MKDSWRSVREWSDLVGARQRVVVRQILIGLVIALVIALVGLFFNTCWRRAGQDQPGSRQMQTLRAGTSERAGAAVLLILLVVLGHQPAGNFSGTSRRGLTVALKDFIVDFWAGLY